MLRSRPMIDASRKRLLCALVASSCLTACIVPGEADSDSVLQEVKPFGSFGGDGSGTKGTRYSDRRGPVGVPWRDVVAGAPAVTSALAQGGKPGFDKSYGPPLVFGETAYFVNGAGPLIAFDLVASREVWKSSVAFDAYSLVSDGASACGLSGFDVVCVGLEDGAERWRYGQAVVKAADLEIRGGALYVSGGGLQGQGRFLVLDMDTGALRYEKAARARFRPFVFVGDDLLLESFSAGVMRQIALDPATGEEFATLSMDSDSALLWALDGKAYFVEAFEKKVHAYDSATNAFTDATGEFAAFLSGMAGTLATGSGHLIPRGITDPLADGTVFGQLDGFSGASSAGTCLWNARTRTTGWCQPVSPTLVRVHPNLTFIVGGSTQPRVYDTVTGAISTAPFRLFFGNTAFEGQSYGKVH